MPIDRSAPVFYIQVLEPGKKKGTRIDLTGRVLAFTFEDHEKKADMLRLTVDNWDLANFDTPVWKKGAVLEVSWGYLGDMAPARQVVIKKVKGSTKLEIEAYSTAFLMDATQRNRCFSEMTRSDIVREIAEEYGYGELRQEIEDTDEVIDHVQCARKTDAAFIRSLAQKEGFEFFVDFDGIHFHKRRVEQPPIRDLVWFADESGTIKSFSIENDVSSQPMFTVTRGRDPVTKKDFEITSDARRDIGQLLGADPEQVGRKTVIAAGMLLLSTGAIEKVGKRGFRTTGKFPQVQSAARAVVKTIAAKNRADAKRRAHGTHRRMRQALVKMKCNIVGDPSLVAKSVIKIGGMGKRLSGNYYVKSHRHTLGSSGFDGEIEIIRDGHSELNVGAGKLFAKRPGGGGGKQASDGGGTCDAELDVLFTIYGQFEAAFNAERKAFQARGNSFSKNTGIEAGNGFVQMRHQTNRLRSNRRNLPAMNKAWDGADRMSNHLAPRAQFPNTIKMLTAFKQQATNVANSCEDELRAQNVNLQPVNVTPKKGLTSKQPGKITFVRDPTIHDEGESQPIRTAPDGTIYVYKAGRF